MTIMFIGSIEFLQAASGVHNLNVCHDLFDRLASDRLHFSVDIKLGPKRHRGLTTASLSSRGYIPPAMERNDAVSVDISPAVVDNQLGMVSLSAPNFTNKSKMVASSPLFGSLVPRVSEFC